MERKLDVMNKNLRDMAHRLAKELQHYDITLSPSKCLKIVTRIHDLPAIKIVKPDTRPIPYHNQILHNQVTLTSHEYGYNVKGS